MSHPFDDAIRLVADPADDTASRWLGRTSPAYWNMVGPFGGITAATLMQALLGHPARQGEPISLSLTYASPIVEGDLVVRTQLVNATRSTQHWSVQILQGEAEKVAVNAIALLATRRPTWGAAEAVMPEVPPAASCEPFRRDHFPVEWVKRYDFRYVRGALPGRGAEPAADSVTQQWVSDVPARELDFVSLTSICDVFFPRLYLRRGRPVPAGTVSLNIYYHADAAALAAVGSQPVLGSARGLAFGGGFCDQNAEIWSPDGRLLANTQQMVWYKE